MDKKSFVIYHDQRELFEAMTDEEAGKILKGMLRFSEGEEVVFDGALKFAWLPIKSTLERDVIKYVAKCEKNKENAAKRWNKKDANACDGMRPIAKHADSDSDSDSDNIKKKKREVKKFTPPSIEDISEYIKEKGYLIKAETFFFFYDARDWRTGKVKMKNWKSALSGWASREPKPLRKESRDEELDRLIAEEYEK